MGKGDFECQYAVVWPFTKNAGTWFCWDKHIRRLGDVHPVKDKGFWVLSVFGEERPLGSRCPQWDDKSCILLAMVHMFKHSWYQVWWGETASCFPLSKRE